MGVVGALKKLDGVKSVTSVSDKKSRSGYKCNDWMKRVQVFTVKMKPKYTLTQDAAAKAIFPKLKLVDSRKRVEVKKSK